MPGHVTSGRQSP